VLVAKNGLRQLELGDCTRKQAVTVENEQWRMDMGVYGSEHVARPEND
jgi:hypothetical protein